MNTTERSYFNSEMGQNLADLFLKSTTFLIPSKIDDNRRIKFY